MFSIITREPVAIAFAAQALLLLAVAFGAKVTAEQIAAFNTAFAAVLSVLVRRKVSPVSTKEQKP
jgi:hypothetical protein